MARFPIFLFACSVATPAWAQPATYAETVKPGDCFKTELSLTLAGKLKVQLPNGKTGSEPFESTARHIYFERFESEDRVIRAYGTAASTSIVAGSKQVKELPPSRSIIVRQTLSTGTLCFHPEHALTRDELELVGEHFDTVALTRLIPATVGVDTTWKLPDDVTAALCQYDALTANGLVGRVLPATKGYFNY